MVVALAAALVIGMAAPALAKGATQAVISGPGLSKPIVVSDGGEPGQQTGLANLSSQSGLFWAIFGSAEMENAPVPLAKPPLPASLGPRYVLTYTVPSFSMDGAEHDALLRQDLYPYALSGALTYTPPGQRAGDNGLQSSGWLRAGAGISSTLASIGLPPRSNAVVARQLPVPPTPAKPAAPLAGWWLLLVASVVVAGALAGGLVWLRRRRVSGVVSLSGS
jgi:hypothetical protein